MFKEKTWKDGEELVQKYMKKHGYKIKMTNFSCVGIELDIVAILPRSVQLKTQKLAYKKRILTDKANKKIYKHSFRNYKNTIRDLLVITEVKARETDKYGKGFEAISDYKKQNIKRGARFLQTDKVYSKYQIRFDVASVDGGKVTYIEDAFN